MLVWKCEVAQSCPTPWTIQSMEYLGQNTGVGSCSLLHRIFLTQESNPGLPHCRRILHQLSHQGSPSECSYLQCCVGFGCAMGVIQLHTHTHTHTHTHAYTHTHTHTHIYLYSFLDSFPMWDITEYWVEFSRLDSGSLLTFYFLYSSMCMLTPDF